MNDPSAKLKYKEILGIFNRLNSEIWNTVESYYIWRTLYFAKSIKVVGKKKAERNVRLMNLCGHFFSWTEYNHLHAFIIGINKFFDKKNLGISAIATRIQKYEKFFTPELIKELYPERFLKDNPIYTKYKPITKRDLSEIERWIKRHENLLKRLQIIRHTQSAHTGFKSMNHITFKPQEIDKVLLGMKKIYNKLSYRFDRATTDWRNLKGGAIKDTNLLLDNLDRGEAQRLAEIKKRWS